MTDPTKLMSVQNVKRLALLQLLSEQVKDSGLELSDIRHTHDNQFTAEPTNQVEDEEWMVLTENEADDLWDEMLEQHIDECIIPELPKAYQGYFDSEAWKRDAKFDGRGHTLGTYDGVEHEIFYTGSYDSYLRKYFLAYRIN